MSSVQRKLSSNLPEDLEAAKQGLSFVFLISLLVLAVSLATFIAAYYYSKIKPFSGYGDDMDAIVELNDRDPRALSGGDVTHFMFGDVSFESEAANLSWGLSAMFDDGDGMFERPFSEALSSGFRSDADGVGPLFNMSACEGCHAADGRASPPTENGQMLEGFLFRVSVPGAGIHNEPKPHPIYGGQLADKAIEGHLPEITLHMEYETITGQFGDGSEYTLQKPVYSFPKQNYGPLGRDTMISPRVAPFMIGMGLLDAITAESIMEYADIDDKNKDGISGKPNMVWSIEKEEFMLGKYGWKAEIPTLAHQSMDAAINDMGITNPLFPEENCTTAQVDCSNAMSGTTNAKYEMTKKQMNEVVTYLEFLAVPGRGYLDNENVMKGEKLFNEVGCSACHRETFVTGTEQRQSRLHNQTIHPYTDMLLHDMGPALADNRPSFDADGYEWRTPPLWGIGMVERVNGHTRFLHDGRARSLEEAVLWHGGEATAAQQRFVQLSQFERKNVIKFLKSL